MSNIIYSMCKEFMEFFIINVPTSIHNYNVLTSENKIYKNKIRYN